MKRLCKSMEASMMKRNMEFNHKLEALYNKLNSDYNKINNKLSQLQSR